MNESLDSSYWNSWKQRLMITEWLLALFLCEQQVSYREQLRTLHVMHVSLKDYHPAEKKRGPELGNQQIYIKYEYYIQSCSLN